MPHIVRATPYREGALNPTLFRILIPVSDIEAAAKFYEVALAVTGDRVSPGRHYFNCGGTILACFDPGADGDGYEAKPLSEFIYFAVDDLEATHHRCRRAGADFSVDDIHGEPAHTIATRPWGERSFYVKDPFGNKLCFVDRTTCFTGS